MAGSGGSPRAVVCLDKFRGSLTADQACDALARGISGASPEAEVIAVPVADGGEGTVDALVRAGYRRVTVPAHDPAGGPVMADFAVAGGRAVIELAQASGLHLTGGRSPLTASTFGTGEVIVSALDRGCTDLVLAVGGSATTDGGAGMLRALGARFRTDSGAPVGPGGQGLSGLAGIDLSGLDPRLAAARIVLASDVSNPLLGPLGAAAVYGPQKGASPADLEILEGGLRRLAEVTAQVTGADHADAAGAGAAGGTGFAALAVLRAERRPGIDFMLAELRLAGLLTGAALAVTGEGRLDSQSLQGKAPVGVARLAASSGVPLVIVAGQVLLSEAELRSLPCAAAYSLAEEAGEIRRAMTEAGPLLEQLGRRIGLRYLC